MVEIWLRSTLHARHAAWWSIAIEAKKFSINDNGPTSQCFFGCTLINASLYIRLDELLSNYCPFIKWVDETKMEAFKGEKTLSNLSCQNAVSLWQTDVPILSRGCSAVGKAVASDTRDPQIESQHRQQFLNINVSTVSVCRIDEKKQEEARNGPLKNILMNET